MGSLGANKKLSKGVSRPGLPFSARLQVAQDSLTPTEKKVGEYFVNNPQAMFLSITEVVEDSGLGYGTIVRFCQRLGCAGFQEFKVLMAQEAGSLFQTTPQAVEPNGLHSYSQKILSDLRTTASLLDEDTMNAIVGAINAAERVLITGIAGSASLAVGFDYHLSRIGVHSMAVCDGYNLAIRAASLNTGDVFFAISFSGATKDVLSAAETARANGAAIISLTSFLHAPLVELADYNLFSATDRDPLSCEIFPNSLATLVLDVLFYHIYNARQDAKQAVEKTLAAVSHKRV